MLLFNSKTHEYILLNGSSTSEVAGQSANSQPLFQLLDTSLRKPEDLSIKGCWAGDAIFLIDREIELNIEIPVEWTQSMYSSSLYDLVLTHGKNITHCFTK